MKKTIASTILTSALFSSAHGAWIFAAPSDLGPAATSASFTFQPLFSSIENGANSVPGQGFDIPPQPIDFSFTSTGAPIQLTFDLEVSSDGERRFRFLNIDLDPDNDDILPSSILFESDFSSQPVSWRGVDNGAVGQSINAGVGQTLDATSQIFDATNTAIDTTGLFARGYTAQAGDNTTLEALGLSGFANLDNGQSANSTTLGTRDAFPFGSSVPTEVIVRQATTVSNFVPGESETFRISFDGGVSIPEPSSTLLLFAGVCALTGRRRR